MDAPGCLIDASSGDPEEDHCGDEMSWAPGIHQQESGRESQDRDQFGQGLQHPPPSVPPKWAEPQPRGADVRGPWGSFPGDRGRDERASTDPGALATRRSEALARGRRHREKFRKGFSEMSRPWEAGADRRTASGLSQERKAWNGEDLAAFRTRRVCTGAGPLQRCGEEAGDPGSASVKGRGPFIGESQL
ncbi:unnamed protein product [Rangifer tarandus platyrhynchus]|uniref:Uncharacterized protein n=2 Tax=Rangifer tarandus platyrhynchus TaxID=3082113 RepID=A0ABN8YVP3_RANTA|nr:unnamed protein product [Rangifer tarandus platyrhynchus]CAI9700342.1 unnamed protein product [Rangifer tarandus platyrhynchus]